MASLLYLIVSMIGLTIHRDHEPQIHWETVDKASSCILYVEGNGSVNCTGDVRRNVCDIECDGKYQGAFICTPESGWSSELPYCAREGKANPCRMDYVENRDMYCEWDDLTLVCDIDCDFKFQGNYTFQGTFTCTRERGWSAELPDCAREEKRDDALMGGCIEAVCVKFCEGNNLKGVCREAYPGGEKLCLCEK